LYDKIVRRAVSTHHHDGTMGRISQTVKSTVGRTPQNSPSSTIGSIWVALTGVAFILFEVFGC
jgi:hypothetical protein